MSESQRYKLTLAYRGTRYHGWQRQLPTELEATVPLEATELPTIQNELRLALIRTLGHDLTVTGASRTDAGVHAQGQVAHFDTFRTQIAPERILLAANAKLPDDIRINSIEPVLPDFDAISGAASKAYRYVIHNAPLKDVFRADLVLHLPRPLNIGAMRSAAAHLVGEHDFASFAKPGHGRETTVRTVSSVTIEPAGEDVHLEFVGGGFLWHQVRIMAGTLMQVGLGRRDPATVPPVLAARNRQAAGPTAPAHGLFLLWVRYEPQPGRQTGV
jgi:tRNA pseudouridine38-40 synthase